MLGGRVARVVLFMGWERGEAKRGGRRGEGKGSGLFLFTLVPREKET